MMIAKFSAALLAGALVVASASAHARDGWFGSSRKGDASVYYGEVPKSGESPNAETIYLSLGCGKRRGTIEIFVAETSQKLKPGRSVRVIVAINGVSHTAQGKTLNNALAGVPSLQVTFPANAKMFAVATGNGTIAIAAGGWKESTPLRGIGKRVARLVRACR